MTVFGGDGGQRDLEPIEQKGLLGAGDFIFLYILCRYILLLKYCSDGEEHQPC